VGATLEVGGSSLARNHFGVDEGWSVSAGGFRAASRDQDINDAMR
jgi:hypothetical protein